MPRGRSFYLEAAKLLDRNSPSYKKMLMIYMRNYAREMRRELHL
jgi:hypothetical protein